MSRTLTQSCRPEGYQLSQIHTAHCTLRLAVDFSFRSVDLVVISSSQVSTFSEVPKLNISAVAQREDLVDCVITAVLLTHIVG